MTFPLFLKCRSRNINLSHAICHEHPLSKNHYKGFPHLVEYVYNGNFLRLRYLNFLELLRSSICKDFSFELLCTRSFLIANFFPQLFSFYYYLFLWVAYLYSSRLELIPFYVPYLSCLILLASFQVLTFLYLICYFLFSISHSFYLFS